MKKLTTRDILLLFLLIVGIIGYVFYEFLWTGLKAEEQLLIGEKESAQVTLNQKNVPNLEITLKNLEEQNQKITMELQEILDNRTFGSIDYQRLIAYMGEQADELNVDLVAFNKLDVQDKKAYTEVPYEVTVQGSYEDIILFVNSLYRLEEYFFFTAMRLLEVERVPMTDITIEGSPNLRNNLTFPWASEFLDDLDENIPPEMRKEQYEEFLKEFAKQIEELNGNVGIDFVEEEDIVYDKLQLQFIIKFVELES